MTLRSLLGLLLVVVFLLPATAFAQVPSHLDDIAGERASSGERDLRDRGYVHIETHKSGDRSHSYWWSASRHECIRVTTQNGRYNDIDEASSTDCNQHHRHHDSDSDAAVGAAVAIGAAALIGALASSGHHHKSHHHESRRHNNDDDYERDFERGHRDGLYNHSYDNHNDTAGYIAGYDSGVEQREHNASHRHHSGRHNSHGYQQRIMSGELNELRDARASSADDQLTRWGFESVDRLTSGNTVYLIWYDRSRGQCLQETMADGRVVSIDAIGHHPACR